ncbi:hypothetical protein ElP_72170 (plasmid) [Tautonia plasticadhaerens]|uniref:Uncharacterized protein n=1 Tax=Tautonia plasticadhaerens TaxID=2527974 RepID=A0A518HEH3_9BACT|nr:hypothetical protein ElP_72170 [Tautonia plasticadhaerens]
MRITEVEAISAATGGTGPRRRRTTHLEWPGASYP